MLEVKGFGGGKGGFVSEIPVFFPFFEFDRANEEGLSLAFLIWTEDMFGTIRKHQKWLWILIMTLTIISFVIFFSPYSKMNEGARLGNHGSINGERITDTQYIDAYREVQLHHFFQTGEWGNEGKRSGFDPTREAYQWLLLVQKERDYGINVSPQVAQQLGRQMMAGLKRRGVDSPEVFVNEVLKRQGLNADDFERFVRHYAGIQELVAVVGMSGELVTPEQAKAFYKREHQEVATEAVEFSLSNYLANVSAPEEALGQFYSNRVANYMIPDRIQVKYVRFNVTNYLAEAKAQLTNLNEIVEMNFQRFGSNYLATSKSPEEAKAKLADDIVRQKALVDAADKAKEFIQALSAQSEKPGIFEELAKKDGVNVEVSAPFDQEEGPQDLDVGSEFTKAAFALGPDEPYSMPVAGRDGIYLLEFDKRIPHETPTLAQIHDKVAQDYKRMQAMRMAQEVGIAFHQAVTNGFASGKSFTKVCEEFNVKPITLPPFSISTRTLPEGEELAPLGQLKQAAFSTKPGEVSHYHPTAEGGFVLYVKEKLPLDNKKEEADLPSFLTTLRRTRQQEAFDDWFRKEAERGLRDTPLARPQPSEMGAAKS